MVDYTSIIDTLKKFFNENGWNISRSVKYLHKEVNGRKYRVNFEKIAVKIERQGVGAWSSQWQNLRSAYYKDIRFVDGKPVFDKVGNDMFTELRTLSQPKEIRDIVQPNQPMLKEVAEVFKQALNNSKDK